jgi:hypothetical protein
MTQLYVDAPPGSIERKGSRTDTKVYGARPLGRALRNGSIALLWPFASHFRSAPINGHRQTGLAGPARARSGRLDCN